MATKLVKVLRAIQPQDRIHQCSEKCGGNHTQQGLSARRRRPTAQHTRKGPQRDNRSDLWIWHTTMRRPWVLREERRAANRRARQARKANRLDS